MFCGFCFRPFSNWLVHRPATVYRSLRFHQVPHTSASRPWDLLPLGTDSAVVLKTLVDSTSANKPQGQGPRGVIVLEVAVENHALGL